MRRSSHGEEDSSNNHKAGTEVEDSSSSSSPLAQKKRRMEVIISQPPQQQQTPSNLYEAFVQVAAAPGTSPHAATSSSPIPLNPNEAVDEAGPERSGALSKYLQPTEDHQVNVDHQEPISVSTNTNVIVSTKSQAAAEDHRPATLALIPALGLVSNHHHQHHLSSTHLHHQTPSAFYAANASPYASSPYSTEPSTPASSLASSGFLHPAYPYSYAGISPTLEFGMFWNAPWPFTAAAAGHHGADMISPIGDLSPSLVEVANCSQYHQAQHHQFSPPLSASQSSQFSCANSRLSAPLNSSLMTRTSHGMRQGSTRKGGRRPREVEDDEHGDLTEEDKDKRNKRRLRNKEAAARCRKRRLDQLATLQGQVDELNQQNIEKERQIELLTNEVREKTEMLNQHGGCKVAGGGQKVSGSHSRSMNSYASNSSHHHHHHNQQNRLMAQPAMPYKRNASPALAEQCLNNSEGRSNGNNTNSNNIDYFKEEIMMESSPSSQYANSNNPHMIMDNDNDPVISDAVISDAMGKRFRMKQEESNLREDYLNGPYERPKSLFGNATAPRSQNFEGMPTNTPTVINTPSTGILDTPCLSSSFPTYDLLQSRTGLTPMTNGPMQIHVPTTSLPHNGELRQL